MHESRPSCESVKDGQRKRNTRSSLLALSARSDLPNKEHGEYPFIINSAYDVFRTIWDIVLRSLRFAQLMILYTPAIVSAPFAYFRGSEEERRWWYRLLTSTLEISGPTFIKLGQWASTRRDLFSHVMCAELGRTLHRDVTPANPERARAHLLSLDGFDADMFSYWNPVPVGSGCIAQVHEAVLREDNRRVAVKIRRPQIEEAIRRDLSILKGLVSCITWIPMLRWYGLDECTDRFSAHMLKQVNFKVEAANLRRFRSNFKSWGHRVIFPAVIHDDESVLVMSFEEGTPLGVLLDTEEADCRRRRSVAKQGLRAFLKMLLSDNFVHADLHPGNILFRGQSIVFLDAGLVVELDSKDRKNFKDLFAAVARGQGRVAARLILSHSPYHECEDAEHFYEEMDGLVSQVNRSRFRPRDIQIGSVLNDVLRIVRENKVTLDPNFANIVISIVLLEGIGRSLDPDIDIFSVSLPFLATQ